MVEVYVNGVQVVELTAGSGGCGGPMQTGDSDTFCVEPCDEVEIITTGNICPTQRNCGSQDTAFDVYTHSCKPKDGGGGDLRSPSDHFSNRFSYDKELALNQEAMRLNADQSLKVYPNPVTDELTITYSDRLAEYQTARIINSAGQLVHTENLSNLNQVQIDASAFPGGIYIIEITGNNGYKIVEKFTKLD